MVLKEFIVQREKHSMLENNGSIGKTPMKPIIYFQTWRVGKLFCGAKFLVGIYMIYFFWKNTIFGT